MYPVRVPPASRFVRATMPAPKRPAREAPPRASAFLDAVCPRCDQRGLDLVPSPHGQAVAVCVHCGTTHPP